MRRTGVRIADKLCEGDFSIYCQFDIDDKVHTFVMESGFTGSKEVRSVDLHQLLSYPCPADKALFLKPVRPARGYGLTVKTKWISSRAQTDPNRRCESEALWPKR